MDERRFGEAAATVLGWLQERGYSASVWYSHRRCYRLIGEHLRASGLEPGAAEIRSWLSERASALPAGALKAYKTAVSRVIGVLEAGGVPDSPLTHRGPSLYDRLPGWAATAVDEYVVSLDPALSDETVGYVRVCAAHFMCFACDRGATRPGDVGAGIVIAYGGLGRQSASTRARRLAAARGVLELMCARGDVPPFVAMLADLRCLKWAACLEPIPGLAPSGGGVDAGELPRLSEEFADQLAAAGYARTPLMAARKALGLLYVFLALNGLRCEPEAVGAWAERAGDTGGGQGKAMRRAALLFASWLNGGKELRPEVVFPRRDETSALPGWGVELLDAYLALRSREGCASSTLGCCRNACERFIAFASAAGASSARDIDAEVVSSFCRLDAARHSTAAGSALYVSKVRSLLEWMADERLSRPGLALAARAVAAPRTRVVEVLDDGRIAAARAAISAADSPMELRDAAMVALGLEMGLRASDVVRITLSDISWRESAITVTQRKTGVAVTLPLTTAAGNAVVAYLRRGRPSCDARELFVSHRAPRRGLCAEACGKAARRVLGEGVTFHELRRTFATGMLRAGSSRREVSEALGHTCERSVVPYLSLDAARLRLCAMSPTELGIGGGGRG